MSEATRLKLKIAGQEFVLRANEREIERLKQTAAEVDQRIQDLQKAGIGSTQRAATMAAFRIAYENSGGANGKAASSAKDRAELRDRVDTMIAQIDQVLQ